MKIPLEIAKTLIKFFQDDKKNVNPEKIINMTHLVQSHNLEMYQVPAFDEQILIEPDGPTIKSLKNEISIYAEKNIPFETIKGFSPVKDDIYHVIRHVYLAYGHMSDKELTQMLTNGNSSWFKTQECYGSNIAHIPYDALKSDSKIKTWDDFYQLSN